MESLKKYILDLTTCLFTFYRSQNVSSPKCLQPNLKLIEFKGASNFFCSDDIKIELVKCKSTVGLAQNFLTSPNCFGTWRRARHNYKRILESRNSTIVHVKTSSKHCIPQNGQGEDRLGCSVVQATATRASANHMWQNWKRGLKVDQRRQPSYLVLNSSDQSFLHIIESLYTIQQVTWLISLKFPPRVWCWPE